MRSNRLLRSTANYPLAAEGEESRLINAGIEQWSDQQMQEILGVSQWIDGMTGVDAAVELLFTATMNIDGIWSGYPASQTSVDASPVQAALSVLKKYSDNLAVQPRVTGSAPFYQFTVRLGLPLVPVGLGFGTGAHAPNEIMLIEPAEGTAAAGLAEVEKAYVDFIFALASQQYARGP